jgi:hypothetical protein
MSKPWDSVVFGSFCSDQLDLGGGADKRQHTGTEIPST